MRCWRGQGEGLQCGLAIMFFALLPSAWVFAVLEGGVGGGVVIIRYGDGVFCFTAIDVR